MLSSQELAILMKKRQNLHSVAHLSPICTVAPCWWEMFHYPCVPDGWSESTHSEHSTSLLNEWMSCQWIGCQVDVVHINDNILTDIQSEGVGCHRAVAGKTWCGWDYQRYYKMPESPRRTYLISMPKPFRAKSWFGPPSEVCSYSAFGTIRASAPPPPSQHLSKAPTSRRSGGRRDVAPRSSSARCEDRTSLWIQKTGKDSLRKHLL